jgi:hypothetical protein
MTDLEQGRRVAAFHLEHAKKHKCAVEYWERIVKHYDKRLAEVKHGAQ